MGAAAAYVKTGVETTLNHGADTDNAETDITVTDGGVFAADDLILIGTEIMKIDSIATHVLTVTRGAESTTAAAQTDADPVYLLTDSTGALVPGAHPDILS